MVKNVTIPWSYCMRRICSSVELNIKAVPTISVFLPCLVGLDPVILGTLIVIKLMVPTGLGLGWYL